MGKGLCHETPPYSLSPLDRRWFQKIFLGDAYQYRQAAKNFLFGVHKNFGLEIHPPLPPILSIVRCMAIGLSHSWRMYKHLSLASPAPFIPAHAFERFAGGTVPDNDVQ